MPVDRTSSAAAPRREQGLDGGALEGCWPLMQLSSSDDVQSVISPVQALLPFSCCQCGGHARRPACKSLEIDRMHSRIHLTICGRQ